MTIPEVRSRLYELADQMVFTDLGKELRQLADELYRRSSPRSRTAGQRIESRHMTPSMAVAIRRYADEHPEMTMLAVGLKFGVNQGRVSEALYGKREETT